MNPPDHRRLALITTSPYQVALFFEEQLRSLPSDIEPLIYSNTEDRYSDLASLKIEHVSIQRSPFLTLSDARALVKLRQRLVEERVSTVLTMSPKAGLVGQVAAAAARVETRVHIFTGQVWQGLERGPKRSFARLADQAIGRLATHLAADSPSQAAFLEAESVAPTGKVVSVPHPPGSIRGVDVDLFRPDSALRTQVRHQYGLSDTDVAFVQLGRIAAAKGVLDLVAAFSIVRAAWRADTRRPEPRLFLVGTDEEGLGDELADGDGVEIVAFTPHPEQFLAGMDVMVLASHREGFGSSIIEGAASGLPSVATDIVGVRDAVIAGQTGWLVPARSTSALAESLAEVLANPSEVAARGTAARLRAVRSFEASTVVEAWTSYIIDKHRLQETERQ